MKYQVTLGITILILLILTIIAAVLPYSLVISEYSMGEFCELQYIPFIKSLFAVFAVFTVAFSVAFVLSIISKKTYFINSKKYIVTFMLSIVLIVAVSCTTVFFSYKTVVIDKYHDDIMNETVPTELETKYSPYFPYYADFTRFADNAVYYSYSRYAISDAEYIHVQNYTTNESNVLYDTEYFFSENEGLLNQYSLQKIYPIVYTGAGIVRPQETVNVYENTEYLLYLATDYYEIRIVNENSYFSIVAKNLGKMMSYNEDMFVKTALAQYALTKTQGTNNQGTVSVTTEEADG